MKVFDEMARMVKASDLRGVAAFVDEDGEILSFRFGVSHCLAVGLFEVGSDFIREEIKNLPGKAEQRPVLNAVPEEDKNET